MPPGRPGARPLPPGRGPSWPARRNPGALPIASGQGGLRAQDHHLVGAGFAVERRTVRGGGGQAGRGVERAGQQLRADEHGQRRAARPGPAAALVQRGLRGLFHAAQIPGGRGRLARDHPHLQRLAELEQHRRAGGLHGAGLLQVAHGRVGLVPPQRLGGQETQAGGSAARSAALAPARTSGTGTGPGWPRCSTTASAAASSNGGPGSFLASETSVRARLASAASAAASAARPAAHRRAAGGRRRPGECLGGKILMTVLGGVAPEGGLEIAEPFGASSARPTAPTRWSAAGAAPAGQPRGQAHGAVRLELLGLADDLRRRGRQPGAGLLHRVAGRRRRDSASALNSSRAPRPRTWADGTAIAHRQAVKSPVSKSPASKSTVSRSIRAQYVTPDTGL